MQLFVGTSGYAYKQWKGKFYPAKLADKDMLAFYGERFDTVEVNNTFYRMPSGKVLERWCAEVPDHFSFSIKASRRITHQGRIKDVADSVDFLFEQLKVMSNKLGPVLFQLPPNLKMDLPRLAGFLDMLPQDRKVAMEFRHISWFDEVVYAALREHDVALCITDGEIKEEIPFVATAPWGYLRLRAVEYADGAIREWAETVKSQDWEEAYIFFKHEDEATGPKLAKRFLEICEAE
jgi:uncharacterized protein YecE (DUF72 family)